MARCRPPSPRKRQGSPGKMPPVGLPCTLQSQRVMSGLVPGIHAVQGPQFCRIKCDGAAWMAGTSPAMTALDCVVESTSLFPCRFGFPGQPCANGERGGRRSKRGKTPGEAALVDAGADRVRCEAPGLPRPLMWKEARSAPAPTTAPGVLPLLPGDPPTLCYVSACALSRG